MLIQPNPIQPDEMIAGCIAVYKNIWPDWANTIEDIEKTTSDANTGIIFRQATTVEDKVEGYNSTNRRTNYDLDLTKCGYVNEVFRKLNNRFFEVTFAAVRGYTDVLGIEESIHFVESFNLLKYQTGQEYGAHYDGNTGTARVVSPILYLNDDYEGGELEFVNFNLKIKPKAGTLYIFPASYPYRHIAHPVKSGTKYAIVTWLHDRQPS